MVKHNISLFLLLCICSLYVVSANGLRVTENANININKTYGNNAEVLLKIRNEEPYPFYNLTLHDETYAYLSLLDVINSGEERQVKLIVTSNNDFSQQFKIKGFYITTVGQSFETYNINVDYEDGLDFCDMTIIRGDTIIWNNLVNDQVTLKNHITGEDVTTIFKNESYSTTFEEPQSFTYRFLRRGFTFTDTCTITVLDDNGLVNDPSLDAQFNLTVDVSYLSTNISVNVLQRNYTMNFLDTQEGILQIINNGNNIARGVSLSGEWFTFDINNFDLEPGITKNIPYKIKVSPRFTDSNQTDKLYHKNISIRGNFDTKVEQFDIFINKATITNNGSLSSYGLIDIIIEFCSDPTNKNICNTEPQIVYRDINESDASFNISLKQEEFEGLANFWFDFSDNLDQQMKNVLENIDSINSEMGTLKQNDNERTESIKNLEETTVNRNQLTTILIAIIVFGAIGVFLVVLINKQMAINGHMRINELKR